MTGLSVSSARSGEAAGPVTTEDCRSAASLTGWVKVRKWYTFAAISLLNSVFLFFLLNLLLYPIMLAKRPMKVPTPMDQYGEDKILKAYPGWREADVEALITETWHGLGFEYEPFVQFKEKPLRGRFINVDPAGFRFSKDQAPWPPRPQAFNVFVFGGSTTFGIGLPDDETIASYLQECAQANHPDSPLAVYNFGRQAYFSSQELILFQELLKAGFAPQVAVFIDGLNDFNNADGQPYFTEGLRRFMAGQMRPSLLDNLPMVWAAHWVSDHWKKPQPQKATGYDDRVVVEGVIDRWLANKKMVETIADRFGVRTIFVVQPAPTYKYDLRYHFLLHSDKGYVDFWPRGKYGYALMENLWAQGKLGPHVLWLADMQQDKRENLYVDAVHYTAPFSKEIAAQICDFMGEHPGLR